MEGQFSGLHIMHFKHLSCDELAQWLGDTPNDLNIIDIRDRVSYSQGHIRGAVHVDNSTVASYLESTDLKKPLIVCCYHGNSSQGAAEYFFEQGFEETYSLDGGFEEWRTKPYST